MKTLRKALLFAVAALAVAAAHASMGMVELPADATSGPVTVFYPATQPEKPEQRSVIRFEAATDAPPAPGNRRLVVISHGSPGSPWVYTDLARALVVAGFTVALPEHHADNYKDASEPGPPSWRRRPQEVTRAIDRLAKEPRFAPALDFDRVGMYGMSAGGHTALTLAGGKWSPSRIRSHCQQHIAQDFHGCAGLSTSLTGGLLDGLKKAIVLAVINHKSDDASWYGHTDPRITAVVAGVPFAVDFDPQTLREPKAALGLITARQDKWLVPRFHSDGVLQQCRTCEHLLDLPTGGHGALLSPLPQPLPDAIAALIGDPPDFRREVEVPRINAAIERFFTRHLLPANR